MTVTPLDAAHAAMETDDKARLLFFERFASSELFILLDSAAIDETTPHLFETSDGTFVLVFDTEERLAHFAEGPAPYAALPGRAIAQMLADSDVGIAFNPEVAPSAMLLTPEAIAWLNELLSRAPSPHQARPASLGAPDVPPTLIECLDSRLASAAGLAARAWLAKATYDDGETGLLLAIISPAPGAENAVAQAVSEALTFSGLNAATLDVAFFDQTDPIIETLEKVGLGIDLPKPETPPAPGSDPTMPPRLT